MRRTLNASVVIIPVKLLQIRRIGIQSAVPAQLVPGQSLFVRHLRNLVKIAGLRPPINLKTNRPALAKAKAGFICFLYNITMNLSAQDRVKQTEKITYICMLGNIALAVLKILTGIFGASAAMIADGVHSFSDLVTDIVLIVGVRLGSAPEDEEHPYGHGRFETFSSLIIALVLILAAFWLFYGGVKAVYASFKGALLPAPYYISLIMAVISIIAKEAMYRYTVRVGRRINSTALISNAWHHRSDAFSSLGVLVGVAGAMFLGPKWRLLDPLTAAFVSLFIAAVGFKIFKMAVSEFLDAALPKSSLDTIKKICLSVEDVQNPHEIKTRKVGYRAVIELHIDFPKETPFETVHTKMSEIEEKLKAEFGEGSIISIHPEPLP